MANSFIRSFAVIILISIFIQGLHAQTTRNVGSGQTYTTIVSALAAASTNDIIQIVDATHTENSITVNKSVTIQGQGANITMLQAAISANSGSGQIFIISAGTTVTLQNITLRYGDMTGQGGAVNVEASASLTCTSCRFTQNRASNGGGAIYTRGTLTMSKCSIDNNSITGWYGGGLCTYGASHSTLVDCTIANNTGLTESGGIENPGNITLINCTIAHNTAQNGSGAIYTLGSLTLKNTIIADNSPSNCGGLASTSQGYNIETGTDCGCTGTGDLQNTDPLLNSLTDNGGPTPTISLQSGSPAINPVTSNGASLTDQRGATRIGTADRGAFEYDGVVPVELTSFHAAFRNDNVHLRWRTATEVQNFGFDIQRKEQSSWITIGFVPGHGTSNSPHVYSFTDPAAFRFDYVEYRLKQIDRNGTYQYSGVTGIHTTQQLSTIALYGSHPNPCNTETTISYALPAPTAVTLRIFTTYGTLIQELVNDAHATEGVYSIPFASHNLPNGIYIYQLATVFGTQSGKLTVAR